ncbi:MAG: hypothetical protein ACE5OZ_13855 [Candidatus Heimdallarchaeota archaeon]
MQVFKRVNEFFIVLPGALVYTPDVLSSFLLVILKLAKIKPISKQYVHEKLGFSLNMVETLFQRLNEYNLLRRSNSATNVSYEITERGKEQLEEGQIYFEQEIDLRLQVTDSPHFVLFHHWHILPRKAVDPPELLTRRITQSLLKERAEYSNLSKRIRSFPHSPQVVGFRELELNFDLLQSLPTQLFSRDRRGNKRLISVESDDPDIISLHSSLWNHLKPDKRDQTIRKAILNSLIASKINLNVEKLEEEICTISIEFEKEKLDLEDHIAFIKWLEQVGWNPQSFQLSFPIYDDWEIRLEVYSRSTDENILLGMFSLHIIKNDDILSQLLKTRRFEETLQKDWASFQRDHHTDFILNEILLFEILWALGTEGKILASRIIERKVMKVG